MVLTKQVISAIGFFTLLLFLLHLWLIHSPTSLHAWPRSCEYLRFPLAGHPVAVVEIHPQDESALLFHQLQEVRLILMEPGICPNTSFESEGGTWYFGRVFVQTWNHPKLPHGQIVEILAGRFR